ncbi:MAG: tRNA glutamyl-Q(34) synthetase GluQRS [Gammaproteobacteria bacterium]|nr:tRNA glutamyl-Q(34) synthetase GluQRS [Gammaproteobacteria bacterium]
MPMTDTPAVYRGRFAPSPTGPLHFGSLVAAVGSYLDARRQGGEWLLRMEDLDPPREQPGAADQILRTLEAYGFEWDGPVWYQSQRSEAYLAALEILRDAGLVFDCACTRRELRDLAPAGIDGPLYPGTCRNGLPPGRAPRAVRMRVAPHKIGIEDRLRGRISQQLDTQVGDFILRRADGLFSYQLAVVVDDGAQGITDVVRGSDLLDSTPRQVYLQQRLGLTTPTYLHLPVATNPAGEKLSKQTHAEAIPADGDVELLCRTLRFLGQEVPADLAGADPTDFWEWAIRHWDTARIPACRTLLPD